MAERNPSRLLVVEDEANLGSTLSERLTREGYSVVWARSLRQARQELAAGRFHLALLDVGLPDGSGFTLAGEIRSRNPGTAMIFLTALGDPDQRVQGLGLGAEDYVVKPFHFQELVLRLENALRRHRHWEEVPGRIEVGRALIDFAGLKATVDGHTTAIGAREAALLRLLIARQGTVVSRDEILDEIWSCDEYPTPRTVDNFIVKLRRIIESDPEHPSILRTVWGAGYQLQLPEPSA
jgi:two-component system alkaline phosphatase synthesis response regulator PhoP